MHAGIVLEARLSWGGEVIAVAHTAPGVRRTLLVADFDLPTAPCDVRVVARRERGELVVVAPRLEVGGAVLDVRIVEPSREILPRARSDRRVARGVAVAAALHASVLALALVAGRTPPDEEEAAAFATLKGYLATIAEREAASGAAESTPEATPVDPLAGASTRKADEAGAAGNPARPPSPSAVLDRRSPLPGDDGSTPRAEERPETFGMIGLLAHDPAGDRESENARLSAFTAPDGRSAMGSIFGETIDDAPGLGGLGLSGLGEGGGGSGAGVGLGRGPGMVGRCDGHCLGAPFGQGFGHGGRITGTHVTKAPYLRCGPSSSPDIDPKAAGDSREGCSAQVNGRLPPEAVQRVVRQSFGRLRACYESGLRRDPGLEGRIAVKFVIDRSGAVVMTSVTERSLPDAEVAACVARAYGAMSFPEPEGGIVTVVYPIIFGF